MAERRYIKWTDEELEAVATAAAAILKDRPQLSSGLLLKEAQVGLPEGRRRNLQGFSVVPDLEELVKRKLASLPMPIPAPGQPLVHPASAIGAPRAPAQKVKPPVAPPAALQADSALQADTAQALAEAQQLLTGMAGELKAAKEEIILLRSAPPPDPAVLIATAPVEELLAAVMTRMFSSIAGERARLEAGLQEAVVGRIEEIGRRLAAERAKIEERLYKIEVGLISGSRREIVPVGPSSPDSGPKLEYMPAIVLAGPPRDAFQRVQSEMMRYGVRLKNLDLTRPTSLPQHDLVIVCREAVAVAEDIKRTTKKVADYSGSMDRLGPFIVDRVKEIRAACG